MICNACIGAILTNQMANMENNKFDGNKDDITKTLLHFYKQGRTIQVGQNFKICGINIPLTNCHNVHYEFRLEASWNSGYMLENHYNQCDT